MSWLYGAYNLLVESEVAFAELDAFPSGESGRPDVRIRIGRASKNQLTNVNEVNPLLATSEAGIWLRLPGIAQVVVMHGDDVWVQPEAELSDLQLGIHLLGPVLGTLLFQRGFLVLHGSAVRIGESCLVCAGGAGDSTLAGAFVQRGFDLVADEVVAVDESRNAVPGFPRVRLRSGSADLLGIDLRPEQRLAPEFEKYTIPVDERFCREPLPIRRLYIITKSDAEGLSIQPLSGLDVFAPLLACTYGSGLMEGSELRQRHLQMCGKLAGTARVSRVIRPRDVFDVDLLVDMLLADIGI